MADLMEREFGVRYPPGHVWKLLIDLGWSPQRPTGRARERNEAQIEHWKKKVWPALKKSPPRGRILIFVDESGLSQRPHRCSTWALRGQTPILQYNFNWKTLPVAAGLTVWNFYFRLYPGSIKKAQVRDFLQALVRHVPGPPVAGLGPAAGTPQPAGGGLYRLAPGWIHQEYLPSYAPEVNPMEFIWAH